MKKILIILILLLIPSVTKARIYIKIDEVAEKRFPVALPNLINTGERRDKRDWARKLPQRIKNDLKMTGVFEFVPSDIYPQQDANNYKPATIRYSDWNLLGVQGLLKGGFHYTKDGKVKLTLYLYDPILKTKLIGQEYTANPKEISAVAHHFADLIMESLTGYPGIFQTRLAYISSASGAKEVYVMGIDGSGQARLTSDRVISISPAWSPGGGKIVYTSFTDDGDAEIKIYKMGEGSSYFVTHNNRVNLSPTFTRNGRQLTVAMSSEATNIFNMSLKGRVLKKLTKSWGIDIAPSWSPDGASFAFASERAGGLHIFRANAGGGNVQRLTYVGYQNDNPAWSPDGKKIAFQGRDQGMWDLFIMNADGSFLQRLTSSAGHNQEPTWAPNSHYMAFSSTRTGKSQIYIMTDQGENQIRVPTKGSSSQPAWGPLPKKKRW